MQLCVANLQRYIRQCKDLECARVGDTYFGMAGRAMTLLPTVVSDQSRSGAASGLINQFISAASFATPSTWLALHDGPQFMLLAVACLSISTLALPSRVPPVTAVAAMLDRFPNDADMLRSRRTARARPAPDFVRTS